LPTHFALYKFYANRKDLAKAEAAAHAALDEGRQAKADSRRTGGRCRQPRRGRPVFQRAALFIFSLKALAFISLRRGKPQQSAEILDALTLLDPEDRVGASVTRSLLESVAAREAA
jgi:hypothetical protein